MLTHFGRARLAFQWPGSVVCIGTFDGIHQGHQEVIRTAVSLAAADELPAVAVTFDRHPSAILAPASRPPYIASIENDLTEFERLGVAATVVLPFNASLSRMSATEFLREILVDQLAASHLVVGHDFALGNDREGTSAWLAERIPTTRVEPFEIDGERVSSRRIREFIAQGNVAAANRWLGHPFQVAGVVTHGQKLGRTLGFPTVNIARSFEQVMLADGVYAARATTKFGMFDAALAVGMRPAVGGDARTIEAFLLNYPGESLYGSVVRLDVIEFLRAEQNFASLEDLVVQMRADVEQVRQIMGSQ